MFKRRVVAAGLVAALALAGAACGDDDDEGDDDAAETTTTGGDGGEVDVAAYCDTYFGIEAAFAADEPDPEEAGALLDDLEASHPEEVDEPLAIMVPAARAALEGDPSGIESQEFSEAANVTGAYNIANCEANTGSVETIDYGFVGVPAEVEAGRQIIEITNGGQEFHEMVLIRKNDGVTQSFSEILALPEEEGLALATPVAGQFAGPPGNTAHLYADLEAGEYVAICFIPVGATVDAPEDLQGPPHFTQGMVSEFTVTG
jgi:hypothetical protein